MLTVNVDVSDGLVNGARGTVEAIIKTGNQVSLVLVKFEHDRVGMKAISNNHYREQHHNAVPINRHEAVFNIGRNKAAEVSRRQFPLVLAWATTIHKVQGLFLDQIVVDMKGKAFNTGQAYVAFSRVKSLQGLFIKNFNPHSIKVSSSVVLEMQRLASHNVLPPLPIPNVVAPFNSGLIKIGHLNVRSYQAKLQDVSEDICIAQTDVMCFTESFLKPHEHVGSLTLSQGLCTMFRCDRAGSEDLSHGGVTIACAPHMLPVSSGIQHHPSLEVVSVLVEYHQLCIVAVYRRPQLSMTTFLPLLTDYLKQLPHSTLPTLILGDFNDNLVSLSPPSGLSTLMSSLGFSQFMTVPTTDQGSLLDHIYFNGLMMLTWMLLTHTILITVPALYLYPLVSVRKHFNSFLHLLPSSFMHSNYFFTMITRVCIILSCTNWTPSAQLDTLCTVGHLLHSRTHISDHQVLCRSHISSYTCLFYTEHLLHSWTPSAHLDSSAHPVCNIIRQHSPNYTNLLNKPSGEVRRKALQVKIIRISPQVK